MSKGKTGKILKEQLSLIKPDEKHLKHLKEATKDFTEKLKKEISNSEIDAEVLAGGSFAKGTLVKKKEYDIDIFVRFDWRYEGISDLLEPVLKKICGVKKLKLKRLHGSRDYFIVNNKRDYYFEVIPVAKIKKPREEKNVTDLSYFHVSYVKRKAKKYVDDILLAKTFFHAQKVYGAESYIQGFHGYAVECLVIYYKGFVKMLKELIKVTDKERIVIDIEKHYKKKEDVFFEMNENRLQSPIVLVDPVYKERNALAALSHETFHKFQKAAKSFLKKPTESFFAEKKTDVETLKKAAKSKKAEFLQLKLKTNRQEGDIAGTKLKKAAELIKKEIEVYFKVINFEFIYDEKKSASVYFVLKSRKEIIKIGPPIKLKKHAEAFRNEHKNSEIFVKNKMLHAKIKVNFGSKKFVENFKKNYRKKLEEMGVEELRII